MTRQSKRKPKKKRSTRTKAPTTTKKVPAKRTTTKKVAAKKPTRAKKAKTRNEPTDDEAVVDQKEKFRGKAGQSHTHAFHNDNRGTLVMIGDKFYELKETDWTMNNLRKQPPGLRPHVRILNLIPYRTVKEQRVKNIEDSSYHEFYQLCGYDKQGNKKTRSDKVTSLKKASQLGADVPAEVAKLLKEKEAAQEEGDKSKARAIRAQLRKLDYKRYIKD